MLLTITKAAKELGLCTAHIRRKIRRGEWPAYRFGSKATRIDVAEIRALGRLGVEGISTPRHNESEVDE